MNRLESASPHHLSEAPVRETYFGCLPSRHDAVLDRRQFAKTGPSTVIHAAILWSYLMFPVIHMELAAVSGVCGLLRCQFWSGVRLLAELAAVSAGFGFLRCQFGWLSGIACAVAGRAPDRTRPGTAQREWTPSPLRHPSRPTWPAPTRTTPRHRQDRRRRART